MYYVVTNYAVLFFYPVVVIQMNEREKHLNSVVHERDSILAARREHIAELDAARHSMSALSTASEKLKVRYNI